MHRPFFIGLRKVWHRPMDHAVPEQQILYVGWT